MSSEERRNNFQSGRTAGSPKMLEVGRRTTLLSGDKQQASSFKAKRTFSEREVSVFCGVPCHAAPINPSCERLSRLVASFLLAFQRDKTRPGNLATQRCTVFTAAAARPFHANCVPERKQNFNETGFNSSHFIPA